MITAASNRIAGILAAAGAAMMLASRRKNAMRAIYKRLPDARPEF
jgi:NADP-dependent 3-hydroxy acid dehydrogenase YdfG